MALLDRTKEHRSCSESVKDATELRLLRKADSFAPRPTVCLYLCLSSSASSFLLPSFSSLLLPPLPPLLLLVVVVVVVVRTCGCTRMSIHTCTQLKLGQHQCASPFGWTDQPETPAPVPSEGRRPHAAVVVAVVRTLCLCGVSVHATQQMHLIMGAVSLWTRPPALHLCAGP